MDDVLCIVMEWAEGKDLGALVGQRRKEKRPFTEDEVLKIFWQLTSALAHCHHDHHMLHRDLKPQNVFLAGNGDVKLGDFGLAKIIEATCACAKTMCGTPVYMSPELCVGQDYDRGADVWALGCVLYELMTLTMPWENVQFNQAGGMSALLKKIANSTLDLSACRKRYSPELCNLLAALLHKQQKARPALNKVLDLDLVKRGAPIARAPAAPVDISDGPSGGVKALPPSWRKVPSSSRPGEYSYMHMPTGYKQAFFPTRDDLPAEVQAALAKATFTPSKQPQGTPRAGATPGPSPGPTAKGTPQQQPTRGGGYGTPQQPTPSGRNGGTPQQPPTRTPQQPTPTGRHAGTPQQPTPSGRNDPRTPQQPPTRGGAEAPLPPNWRKVPSASRPGQFSYVHLPTGYKQAEVPTTDAPPPAMLAAWKANNVKGTAGGVPPPTAGGGQMGRPNGGFANRLQPVLEQPSKAAPQSRQPFVHKPSQNRAQPQYYNPRR